MQLFCIGCGKGPFEVKSADLMPTCSACAARIEIRLYVNALRQCKNREEILQDEAGFENYVCKFSSTDDELTLPNPQILEPCKSCGLCIGHLDTCEVWKQ
jgi:hypothetical protein